MTTARLFNVRATHKKNPDATFTLTNVVAKTRADAIAFGRVLASNIVERVGDYRFEVVSEQSTKDQGQ